MASKASLNKPICKLAQARTPKHHSVQIKQLKCRDFCVYKVQDRYASRVLGYNYIASLSYSIWLVPGCLRGKPVVFSGPCTILTLHPIE